MANIPTETRDVKVVGKLNWSYRYDEEQFFCNFCDQQKHHWSQFRRNRIDPDVVAKMDCWFQRLIFQVFLDFVDAEDIEIHVFPLEGIEEFCRLRFWVGEDIGAIYLFGPYDLPPTTEPANSSSKVSCAFPGVSVEQRLAVAAGWLQNCVSSHQECREPLTSELEVPSRLLDMSAWQTTGLVKLIETKSMKVQYAALSHCWGDGSPLTTTKATLPMMTNGIRFTDLPLSFQDTVRVCNALGIRFLWIDSLCIVQDDHEEWLSEAQGMCAVYEHAYVTIAATSSKGCSEGFLHPQAPNLPKSYSIPAEGAGDHDQPRQLLACLDYGMYHNAAEPLHLRAWCLQEWLLPKRLLSFRNLEMEYLCCNGKICDCNSITEKSSSTNWVTTFTNALKSSSDAAVHRSWLKLVQDYSRRRITKHSDRIPALAGLANKFGQRLPSDTFLAGLWARDIFNGLGFYISTREKARSLKALQENAACPSWSWASLPGVPVFLALEDVWIPSDAIIQSAFWSLLPPTRLSPPRHYIEIIGRLIPAHLHFDDTDERSTQAVLYPFLELKQGLVHEEESALQFASDCQLKPVPVLRSNWEPTSELPDFSSCSECSASIIPPRAGRSQEVEESYKATSYTTAARTSSSGHKFEALVYCLRILEPGGSKDRIEHSIVLGNMRELEIGAPNYVPGPNNNAHAQTTSPRNVRTFQRIGYFMNRRSIGIWDEAPLQKVIIV